MRSRPANYTACPGRLIDIVLLYFKYSEAKASLPGASNKLSHVDDTVLCGCRCRPIFSRSYTATSTSNIFLISSTPSTLHTTPSSFLDNTQVLLTTIYLVAIWDFQTRKHLVADSFTQSLHRLPLSAESVHSEACIDYLLVQRVFTQSLHRLPLSAESVHSEACIDYLLVQRVFTQKLA